MHNATTQPGMSIRPLAAADRTAYLAAYDRLSASTVYRRFGAFKPHLSERELAYLLNVDHHAHEALVAWRCEDGGFVGIGRFVRVPGRPHVAEIAITVADEWQGVGIGAWIGERLMQRAAEEGFSVLLAETLPENQRARRMLRRMGFRSVHDPDTDLLVYELPITSAAALDRPAPARGRQLSALGS
jgi:GNAT superfamily N-acetyltransferase